MPALNRVMAGKELQRLIQMYLQAETDIINEIGRLRSLGLVDYHVQAALDRVQAILRKLEDGSWEYVPQMIERNFYVSHPEARKPSARSETPEKHERGYSNAAALTGEQVDIVQRLTMNLMGELVEANATVYNNLSNALLGRTEPDIFRRVGLEQTAAVQAAGRGVFRAVPDFVEALRREGVTAFVDKAGRNWSLHPNCLHQILRWTPMGRSEEEIQKIKDFSSFAKNPPSRDPRTRKQIEAYRKKEQARACWLASYRQFEEYRTVIPGDTPKMFQTFFKHKLADDENYKEWKRLYRAANREARHDGAGETGD